MNIKRWFLICLLCWVFFPGTAFSVVSYQDTLVRYEFIHPQMGTTFRFVLYSDAEEKAQAAVNQAFDSIDAMNASMSDYLPDSELSRLCLSAGTGKSVPVSKDLWQILKQAKGFSRQSRGAFDPTIGPLTRLWRRARNLKELPDSIHVQEAKALVGFQNLCIQKRQKIRLRKAGMRLDLGGIAQGYAADHCLKILKENGITQALVDAGGDIALGDAPPGESGWKVEIPDQSVGINKARPDTSTMLLYLSNCGITTSGATFRYLEINGKRYSHIIDPRSGWGLTHHVLATVQAPTATEADAWATALSVLGESGWQNLPRKPKKLKVWLTENKL